MCKHPCRTVPSQQPIRVLDSKVPYEILFEATVRICLDCEHTIGTASSGSLFQPTKFDFEGDSYDQALARAKEKYLQTIQASSL